MSCIRGHHSENKICIEMDNNIYHEKQTKEMCALHALNNLFQDGDAFSRKQLDDICFRLSPNNLVNPHKSVLGLGNYDINVIMAALQTKGFEAVWFDKRKSIECLALENILGFILNIPTEYKWGMFRLPFHRKHWIGIREISGFFYNLDSKLDVPETIGNSSELLTYLKEQIEDKDKQLFLVVMREVDEKKTWFKNVSLDGVNSKINFSKCQNGSNRAFESKATGKTVRTLNAPPGGIHDMENENVVDQTDLNISTTEPSLNDFTDIANSTGSRENLSGKDVSCSLDGMHD